MKGCYKGGYKGMMVQRNIMMKYGGYSQSSKKRSYLRSTAIPMIFSGEYTLKDMWGIIKGHSNVLEVMWPEVGGLNLKEMCPEFKIPAQPCKDHCRRRQERTCPEGVVQL